MRRLAADHGLRIGAIHAPSLLLTRSVWGTDPVGKIDVATRVAADADVPLVVTHPPYRWQRAYRDWLYESLPTVEARTGITVAIENMFPVHVGRRPLMLHANQDLDQLAGFPHLVLDTSHAAVAKHDLVEVRQRFADRLRHVHLSDNAGKGWDSHLPPGRGRARPRRVPPRARRQRLRRHGLARGRPAEASGRPRGLPGAARRDARTRRGGAQEGLAILAPCAGEPRSRSSCSSSCSSWRPRCSSTNRRRRRRSPVRRTAPSCRRPHPRRRAHSRRTAPASA